VRVRNISSTGAMIETNGKVRVGATPLFELGDAISISAIVEWAVGDQVGLRFQEPFDVDMLAEARPTVASTSNWTPPTYLGKTVKNDDRWGRADLAELREQLEGFIRH